MRPRRGFTLIEVTVFSAVGILVMGGAWSFFQASILKGKATDRKAEGVQTVLLLGRAIERDLSALYEAPGYQAKRIEVATQGIGIRFYRYGPSSPSSSWEPLVIEPVTYLFESTTKQVTRQVGNGPRETLYGLFERVNFRLDPDPDAPPRAPASAPAGREPIFASIGPTGPVPPPAAPGAADSGVPASASGPIIVVSVVTAPRETLRKPLEERSAKERTIFFFASPRRRWRADGYYRSWNPAPYFPPAPSPAPDNPG